MIETTISEQTLSPSSSEIMRKATRLVDQLLLKTSNDFSNGGAALLKQNNVFGSRVAVAEENMNCESNSITDSETFSALNSARKSIPSIDIIKRLAGRLKNKDSDTISELNFPKRTTSNNQDVGDHCFKMSDNCRSKSASPTNGENKEENNSGLSHDFAQMNAKLSEINKRVESLSSNIEDIQDTDRLEDVGYSAKVENRRDFNGFDGEGNANPGVYEEDTDDNYLSQLNVAVLQQERLRMWARDNAKYASSISNTSESGNNRESEHIPFSDVYYTHQSFKYRSGELTSSSGILNSSVLSTTASGTTGQFAHSNDTAIYEAKSNVRNCVSEFSGTTKFCTNGENSENKNLEAGVTLATGSFGRIPGKFAEPKALRFIRVGNQLRRSITVTPLVEDMQRILSREVVNPNVSFNDSDFDSRIQFNSKLEKLINSNISPFNSSKSSGQFSNNMVIITVKDSGSGFKKPIRPRTIDDAASIDSAESDRNYFFSCRECSWNPANACQIQ
ncbi:uncharacterized protein cubi_01144 [Cryptosporidium ubiquitum]|uniref:Uncharacterized protein n=1 Tax=Cryptosporidium ubiquitum TaxID=857276 RepID=A0A1J4MMQ8_9CRYT|nr:uncharacterized protein cubi_01144 [Cryptosporidium ubiquitum]OII74300.1 hypothetical protein cubi_01144 [Cryptosporidium ubiquitum]